MSHRLYNDSPSQYLQTVPVDETAGVEFDLAIIEFDDHGTFWKVEQIDDTVAMIRQRNADNKNGIFVIPFVHGWQNNADPNRKGGDLVRFRED
ncbi:MAG: hypothetical protein AAF108_10300 [Planctomycetota bacterium]